MDKNNRKYLAFSLAELLITLAIISVLMMVLLPILRKKPTDAIGARFRKAFSTLEYVVNYMAGESGYYSSVDGFADMTPISTEGTKNKFCYWFKESLNVQEDFGCPNNDENGTKKFAYSTDDILWFIYPATFVEASSNYDNKIIVDVNGEKSPNCLSNTQCATYKPTGYTCGCAEPDTFIFGIRYDGKVKISNDSVAESYVDERKKL